MASLTSSHYQCVAHGSVSLLTVLVDKTMIQKLHDITSLQNLQLRVRPQALQDVIITVCRNHDTLVARFLCTTDLAVDIRDTVDKAAQAHGTHDGSIPSKCTVEEASEESEEAS